jgi:phosphatidyl-myo-inositol dimannoside synthase
MPTDRILVVTELFPPAVGGSAVLFDNVYSRLSGMEVTVVTDTVASPPSPGVADSLRTIRCRLSTPEWGVLGRGALRHHLGVARTIRRLAAGGADVHCGRALPEGLAAWIAHFAGGPRYACWAHGEDIASALTSRELSFLMRRVYRDAFAVFANSRNTASMLEALGLERRRVFVVYPGVDTERFSPTANGTWLRGKMPARANPVLLTVGRLQRRKGHDLVLAALPNVRRSFPAVHYVIAGDGEERGRLERLAAEHGVANLVTFLGQVPDEHVPGLFAACDIFVMPNRDEGHDVEGFGIVFLEAASAEKPAIGGRSGGVPEAIEDGVTGLLVGGSDPAELASAVERLASRPALRAEFGAAGRARVRLRFSWELAANSVRHVHS